MSDDDPTLAVARDLRAIIDMHVDLPDQAAARSASKDMPGGLAMAALGPASMPSARVRRGILAEDEWLRKHGDDWCELHETIKAACAHRPNPWADEEDVWEPPLQTLLWWSEDWRDQHGSLMPLRPTEQTEAKFLASILQWAYDREPHWDDFAHDVKTARRRLEDVLYAGDREERTRVPCIDCDTDRAGKPLRIMLIAHYAPAGGRCGKCNAKWDRDHWVCPRCKRQYDKPALHRAEYQDMVRRGLERFITLPMAAESLDLPVRRLRPLANACDLATRALLVWWPTVRHIRRHRETTSV